MTESFGSMMRLSSDDSRLLIWFSWNYFLSKECPHISKFLLKIGAGQSMESFSRKQVCTLSHLVWMASTLQRSPIWCWSRCFCSFKFETWLLSVVEVLLCSNLKDDFSIYLPIYLSTDLIVYLLLICGLHLIPLEMCLNQIFRIRTLRT